ncbi:hypothetical protein [Nocardia tenerifensis]|uniref:hypothetical protein n=1 Tax=Nocardia tenerifensis TaxID=228006 RepID=UPI0011B72B14|nr:hypothetical protein [Nocardia tenerifensis]
MFHIAPLAPPFCMNTGRHQPDLLGSASNASIIVGQSNWASTATIATTVNAIAAQGIRRHRICARVIRSPHLGRQRMSGMSSSRAASG